LQSVELVSSSDLPAQKTSLFRRDEEDQPIGDMHAQATMITGREKPVAPRSRAELHSAATMMLDGRAADALRAQINASGALHEQKTRIIDARVGRSSAKVEVNVENDAPEDDAQEAAARARPRPRTREKPKVEVREEEMPQQATRLASPKNIGRELPSHPTRMGSPAVPARLSPPPAAPPKPARSSKDTAPDAVLGFDEDAHEATVPRRGKKSTKERGRHVGFASDPGEGSITNPIGDDDLEEV
jgi:hypothetical protein